jgi:predicted S18 family serine protease
MEKGLIFMQMGIVTTVIGWEIKSTAKELISMPLQVKNTKGSGRMVINTVTESLPIKLAFTKGNS